MVTDTVISSEFLTHRVVQQYSVPRREMSSWILAENEKIVNISEKVFPPL